jgi:hypothetical protein
MTSSGNVFRKPLSDQCQANSTAASRSRLTGQVDEFREALQFTLFSNMIARTSLPVQAMIDTEYCPGVPVADSYRLDEQKCDEELAQKEW